MVHARFKYRDEFCRDGKFREQECHVRSVDNPTLSTKIAARFRRV